MERMKIFGIGLSKTGTTSLASALQILGFRTRDNMGVERYRVGDVTSLDLEVVESHDALTDTPIPSFYRELDARYPKSRFILTVRERGAWLQSCKKQFTQKLADKQNDAHRRLFIELYGTDVFDEAQFAQGYDRFVEGVLEHFRGRPHDLLVLDVAAGDGWAKLCPFLDRPQPDVAFPKANVTRLEWIDVMVVAGIARQAGIELARRRPGAAASLLDRTINLLRGYEDWASAARAAAQRSIVKGLKNLTPDIPVVTPESEPVAYQTRRGWNHFWLVHPLDGERAYHDGEAAFSVDIALIEDGRPICGVVYAPAEDIAYCGRFGKSALRSERGGAPQPLRSRCAATPGGGESTRHSGSPLPVVDGSSIALAMCGALSYRETRWLVDRATCEWETAAAHAVLSGAGVRVIARDTDDELAYNRPDIANGPFSIESKR